MKPNPNQNDVYFGTVLNVFRAKDQEKKKFKLYVILNVYNQASGQNAS
jgi:hypothetical protein